MKTIIIIEHKFQQNTITTTTNKTTSKQTGLISNRKTRIKEKQKKIY